MNMQPPEQHDPRDDSERLEDMMLTIALDHAKKAHDNGHTYLKNITDDWKPHSWVIAAMMEVARFERQRHNMIQDTMADTADRDAMGTVRATVAAILETMSEGNFTAGDTEHSVTINLDRQRTIWDRVNLTSKLTGDGSVTFTLTKK